MAIFALVAFGRAQKQFNLTFSNTDNLSVFKKIEYKKKLESLASLQKEVSGVYLSLINQGYVAASIDSITHDSTNYTAYVTIAQKYAWLKLNVDKKDEFLLSKLGYYERYYVNRTFKYKELSTMMEKIIEYYENNGYPFCSAYLDSIHINENAITATLAVAKNKLIKLDSLVIEGNASVRQKFLLRYLGIKNGMLYNEATYASLNKKIKQLPFVIEKKASILRLTDKQNKLYLFLDKKNASQFDGIVGILPNDKGKTVFTGDVKIKLINTILRNGETFDVNWRRLQTQTQDLKAKVIYPYLFGLPFGFDYNIKLYKKDTTFIDITNGVGINYYFKGLNYIKAFYKQRNANLISTSGLATVSVLPDYADVITKAYGLGLGIEKFDYKFNPRSGYLFNFQVSAGNRQIKKNPKVNDVAYSNLSLKSSQYQLEGELTGYINLIKNHVVKVSSQFGSVFGNSIYKNELYRMGGLRTLRGFDEESIFASSFIIPTLEYRYLFEKNSNLFVFVEGAVYENSNVSGYTKDTPLSLGAGINFETKAGIFNLSYGIGKQYNTGFDLRTGKIHAGLTALF